MVFHSHHKHTTIVDLSDVNNGPIWNNYSCLVRQFFAEQIIDVTPMMWLLFDWAIWVQLRVWLQVLLGARKVKSISKKVNASTSLHCRWDRINMHCFCNIIIHLVIKPKPCSHWASFMKRVYDRKLGVRPFPRKRRPFPSLSRRCWVLDVDLNNIQILNTPNDTHRLTYKIE